MTKPVQVNDNTAVAMPIRNMLAIIGAVAVGVWSYFGIVERLNISETKITLLEKDLNQAIEMLETDLEKNTEFRIKWPRGEMGSLPADSEQFMLIEDLYKSVEKLEETIEKMQNNKINISFLQEQMKKAKEDIEKLKDADREIVYKNGNGN
tara:strand:- start:1437 stop:1889 length:453 start_codon:yes stop_codon:yes gene_type:complete